MRAWDVLVGEDRRVVCSTRRGQSPCVCGLRRWLSVSEYPLSAACAIARVTNSLEMRWQIT